MWRKLTRLMAYAWAAPNSLIGVVVGLVFLCLGAKAGLVRGVIEISGGALGRLLTRAPERARFSAITLGHVIIAVGPHELSAVRRHEHVHVRQYERWGPAFLPAYVLSSVWQLLKGRRFYRDNAFERQAYGVEGAARPTGRHRQR